MSKIKVLYIHQDGLITGSAISLKYFLGAINRDIFEPVVLLAEEGPARSLFEEIGIDVYVFNFPRLWTSPGHNWYSPSNVKQLKAFFRNKDLIQFIKDIQPNIIHVNDKAAINATISAKRLGIPIVQHLRSTYNDANIKVNALISSRFIKNNSNAIISISEDEADLFDDVENLHIVSNTVSTLDVYEAVENKEKVRAELRLISNTIVISFIGAVSSSKGIFSFVEMAYQLIKKYKHFPLKFLIVGKASEAGNTVLETGKIINQPIAKFIEVKGITKEVEILGFKRNPLSIMAASDIIVVPNKISVMGRQPIEAQALGVPVVVAQGHSGKSTIVVDGEGGFIVESPVKIDELVAKVEILINDPKLREEMGKKGMAYAKEKFNPETNMRKIEAIYLELLEEAKKNNG